MCVMIGEEEIGGGGGEMHLCVLCVDRGTHPSEFGFRYSGSNVVTFPSRLHNTRHNVENCSYAVLFHNTRHNVENCSAVYMLCCFLSIAGSTGVHIYGC